MDEDRIETAIERIEAARLRLEAAAEKLASREADDGADSDLAERHAAMKRAVADNLTRLDDLIGRLEA